jgi:Tfp pilus assembly protein PilN
MANINFVPEDYIQNSKSYRTNLMYLVLLMMVMLGLGSSFMVIKMRQRALNVEEGAVNARLAQAQEAIRQFEDLQAKRRTMMKTALTTAGLLESVPKSILLASLTNNLPAGVSLLKLNFVQKEIKQPSVPATKYQQAQAGKTLSRQPSAAEETSKEKLMETHIDIEGIAPTDRQVAEYIRQLSNSALLDNVALVESKEIKSENAAFRQFKLSTVLKNDIRLTAADIEAIKGGA